MKFSIIIPNYNSEKWIEKCINSVLNQTFKDYELIIVDDISTDSSDAIVYNLIKNNENCKMIWNKTKRLNGGTRNVGIAEAQGDYIIFIDCDDWLKDNNVLQEINDNLNDQDIMFLSYECLTENACMPMILNFKDLNEAIKNIIVAPWTKIVKTKLLKETYFPEGTLFEDRIQHYKLLRKCKTFSNLGKTTHIWNRLNKNSISVGNDYVDYRFNYCGELYRFIKEIEDSEFKEYLKNELKGYLKSCDEMVENL